MKHLLMRARPTFGNLFECCVYLLVPRISSRRFRSATFPLVYIGGRRYLNRPRCPCPVRAGKASIRPAGFARLRFDGAVSGFVSRWLLRFRLLCCLCPCNGQRFIFVFTPLFGILGLELFIDPARCQGWGLLVTFRDIRCTDLVEEGNRQHLLPTVWYVRVRVRGGARV